MPNRVPFPRTLSLCTAVAALLVVSSEQFGCSGGQGTAEPTPTGASEQVGTVGMAISLPGGELLNQVSWTITGPNGASTIVEQGTLNLQNSTVLSFTVGAIPAGSSYSIALSGTTVDGTSTCTGAATFSITARATTNVTVLMQCASLAPDAGTAAVTGQTYNCATATAVSASPSETTLGNSVLLSGSATAPNTAGLVYSWSAPSGSFSAPTSPTTSFTCTAAGQVTVTLTVSDGTVPDGGSCNRALASMSAQIQCDTSATVPAVCSLGAGGAITHVIYVQFDNVHLDRDPNRAGTTNVPSDLEQMPHLLNFIRNNGTMMANDHTQLISHTAGGILTSLTGVYPDRHGQTVTNSYVRTSSTGAFSFPSSFQYWTDSVSAANTPTVPNLVQPDGTQMPAPWVAYTRAGCNFGAVALADMELENVSTGATGDMTKVFGSGSPQWLEAASNSSKAVTDFEGLAVHCAQGSPVCSGGEADLLPAEPGGYTGFMGLFGAQQINPALTPGQEAGAAVVDMLGNPIQDVNGNPGFPGFDGMTAAVSLGYMAAMQEHGVPVTYAYISDAHDNHGVDGTGQSAYGPGEAGYVAQLAAYDEAFANFFTRLSNDGINSSNTLFVFTVDEGDHFVGVAPSPANCDGVAIPCTYPPPSGQSSGVGEVDENIDLVISAEQPAVASMFVQGDRANPGAPYDFTVHGDDAPTFYLSRRNAATGTTGALSQTDPVTRNFERAAAALTVADPYTGGTDSLLYRMADQTGMQAIHMVTTGDPNRNPTFVYFADDDYYVADYGLSCSGCIDPAYAWNHGDDQSIIGQTWLGFVGPGVRNEAYGSGGSDQTVWTDHTDVRPTINSILGLQDKYSSDGRVITQALLPSAYSSSLASNFSNVESLGDSYKQVNAPFNTFGQCVLSISTAALQASDSTYASLESQIANMVSTRNTLASEMIAAINGAAFGGTPVDPTQAANWILQAQALLSQCAALQAQEADAGSGASGSSDGRADAGQD